MKGETRKIDRIFNGAVVTLIWAGYGIAVAALTTNPFAIV